MPESTATITNFPSSFITFCGEGGGCNEFNSDTYPIHFLGDIAFAIGIESDEDEVNFRAAITTQCFDPDDDIDAEGEYIIYSDIAVTSVADYTDTLALNLYSGDADMEIDLGEDPYNATEDMCLHIVIYNRATNKVVCCSDQQFKYVSNLCYTQVIKYRCADDAYGFPYETILIADASYYNKIRLDIDVTSPRPVTSKKGFTLSSGAFRTLAATKQKQWDCETDYYTAHPHLCLDAALDHDAVYMLQDAPIDSDFTAYQVFHPEDDKYDIDWQDKPGQHLGIAKSKFKIKTNPYYSQNSNC